ncbi:hypothetical protein GCM10008170_05470 [Methylopila capsulata]|uniref:Uncharacterized protein n=1 Tax=Methylopila capsulata TaxID=61654 RepID=A0A9W6IQA5_9HYPH|nr:hypothetical protein GCM10008170_05470 [Methylopila capsulata]
MLVGVRIIPLNEAPIAAETIAYGIFGRVQVFDRMEGPFQSACLWFDAVLEAEPTSEFFLLTYRGELLAARCPVRIAEATRLDAKRTGNPTSPKGGTRKRSL